MKQNHLATQVQDNSGFTLMEMMIVIVILGLLGALVGTNFMRKLDEARVETTKNQIRQLGINLSDFKRVCGFYPTTEQGLEALISKPTGGRDCKNYDPEGFLGTQGGVAAKKLPQDAWSNSFIFSSDGNKFTVKSLGADNAEGGEGTGKDISSDDI